MAREAKEVLVEWISDDYPWDVFSTLTFDQKRWPENPSNSTCRLLLEDWTARIHDRLKRPVAYLFGIENHASGRHHMHGLVAIEGAVSQSALSTMRWEWGRIGGWADIRPIDDIRKCAAYVLKEYTKPEFELITSRQMGERWNRRSNQE